MMDCRQTKHPLQRPGTHQSERLLRALIPANLRLDDRSIADLLAFAGEFAKHVRYWNLDNTPAGDWTCFWEKDATPLLAIIASTDLETIRSQYRDLELAYYRLKKEEEEASKTDKPSDKPTSGKALQDLVLYIFDTAKQVQSLCAKVPARHPLKDEIARVIKDKLRQPLAQLIAYHKGIATENIIGQYQQAGFLGTDACGQAWGMTNEDFLCIDYWEKDYDPQALWQLFLAFYKALAVIVSKAERAFQKSLQGRSDHPPHIALFLSFLHLFRHLQGEINNFTEKHLIFYYRDVLRLQERREIPDRVHLVFELAQEVQNHLLAKDVQFLGGKDALGLERYYALEDELVVNRAKLVEKKNLYVWQEETGIEDFRRTLSVMLQGADMKDGVEKPFAEGLKEWHPFSGKKLYDRLNYKLTQINKLKPTKSHVPEILRKAESELSAQLVKLRAFTGFTVSTPELVMGKASSRVIFLKFEKRAAVGAANLVADGAGSFDILEFFDIELSTAEGIKQIESSDLDLQTIEDGSNILHFTRAYRGVDVDFAESDNIVILNSEFPDISIGPDGSIPFIRFVLKDPEKTNFRALDIESVTVTTAVNLAEQSGVSFHRVVSNRAEQNMTLFLGSQRYEAGQPVVVLSGDSVKIEVKYDELFLKNLRWNNDSGQVSLFIHLNNASRADIKNNVVELLNGGVFKDIASFATYTPLAERDKVSIPSSFSNASLENGWASLSFQYDPTVGEFEPPPPPLVFSSKDISIGYLSAGVTIPLTDKAIGRHIELHKIQHFSTFGEWTAMQGGDNFFPAIPTIVQPTVAQALTAENVLLPPVAQQAHGNLFLGFEEIAPGQVLSLLIHTAEGTGNPDKIAPEILWSYLRDNEWVQFPPQFILKDETFGMQRTGILRLLLPTDINNGNTWIKGKDGRKDLYWLRASATEDLENNISVEALPMLRDIFPQAGAAVFQNNGNALSHLEEGLPAKTIAQLRFREVKIRSITQPFPTFGGRFSEAGDRMAYYRRIHERLRHRQRAVNVYDYERLVLEQFPKIALVKCLPHSAYAEHDSVARPGRVQVAVLPYPDKMIGARKFYPSVDAGDLTEIQNYLNRHNSLFVSDEGGTHFCCCETEKMEKEHDCNCKHCDNRLQVINARMEPLRLQVCVRFKPGKDIPFFTKKLNDDLKGFLAPWAVTPNSLLLFGATVSATHLLQFVEMLDYVDVVMDLKYKHFNNREQSEDYESEVPWQRGERIEPYTSRSVLTTYLDVLNDENPNVVDHDIHVIDDQDACKCLDCEVDKVSKVIDGIWRTRPGLTATEISRDERVIGYLNKLNLYGEKPREGGTSGTRDSFKLRENNGTIEVTLATRKDGDAVFTVSKPILKNRT